MMTAAVFVEPGRIVLDDKRDPEVGPRDALDDIETVYEPFAKQRDGVLRVAITP